MIGSVTTRDDERHMSHPGQCRETQEHAPLDATAEWEWVTGSEKQCIHAANLFLRDSDGMIGGARLSPAKDEMKIVPQFLKETPTLKREANY